MTSKTKEIGEKTTQKRSELTTKRPGKVLSYIAIDSDLRAGGIMTSPVFMVGSDWKLSQTLEFLFDQSITGAPVINEDGKPVGVVTLRDIAHYTFWHLSTEEAEDESPIKIERDEEEKGTLKQNLEKASHKSLPSTFHLDRMEQATVKQIMMPHISVVREDSKINEVLDLILKKKYHRVFVIDYKGKLKGVVSTVDVVRWLNSELKAYDKTPGK